jgi:L-alanine-DL-glutamate epimerase-like enolase superfamily enzyme
MVKIAAMTQAWNLKFAPHAMEHMHMHLVSATPNAPFLERLRLFEDVTAHVFRNAPLPVGGHIAIPDLPGHGLVLDMDFIREADESGRAM